MAARTRWRERGIWFMRILSISLALLLAVVPAFAGIRFDVDGDKLTRTTSLPSSDSFTACGWINRRGDTGDQVFVFGLVNTAGTDFVLLTTDSGGDNLTVQDTGAASSTIVALTIGQWFGVCITGNGTGAGGLVGYALRPGETTFASASTGGEALTENNMNIGGAHTGVATTNMDFSNWKVWTAILTQPGMINELYSRRPRRTAQLNMWSQLRGSWDIFDYSGAGTNWTAGGTLADSDDPPIPW